MPQSLCTKCCRQISQISKFITQAQACNDKLMIMITSGHIDCLKEEAIDLPTETSSVFDEKLEYDMDVAKEKYDIMAHQSIETLDKNYSVGNWDNKDEVLLLSTLQSDTSHNSVGGSKSYDDKDEVLHFSTLQSDTDEK